MKKVDGIREISKTEASAVRGGIVKVGNWDVSPTIDPIGVTATTRC